MTRIRFGLIFSATLALLALSHGGAQALDPSGKAVGVVPSADAAGASGRRVLRVDGDIFAGDKVQTGPQGEAQILFKDQTRLVVGPNALMTIDSFVFDESNTARKITLNAAKGAFRFITGNSQKQAYSINTPAAAIGVRGTRFDFTVAANGELTFALFDGEVRMCTRDGRCRNIRGTCAVVVAAPGNAIPPSIRGDQRDPALIRRLPYVTDQSRLRRDFRVNAAGCTSRDGTAKREDREDQVREQRSPSRGSGGGEGGGTGDGETPR